MNWSRLLNFVLIAIGGAVSVYSQAEESQNPIILIIGIVFLMTGIYRLSRTIPSKFENENSIEEKEDGI